MDYVKSNDVVRKIAIAGEKKIILNWAFKKTKRHMKTQLTAEAECTRGKGKYVISHNDKR